MEEMVFLDPPRMKATPFTTSEVVARFAGVQHHAVQQLCARYQADLEEFGKVAFEMRALAESKTGQSAKVYHLNEGQAVLILAYLRNTPQVRRRAALWSTHLSTRSRNGRAATTPARWKSMKKQNNDAQAAAVAELYRKESDRRSSMIRDSSADVTFSAIRLGIFAFIRP